MKKTDKLKNAKVKEGMGKIKNQPDMKLSNDRA